MCDSMAVCLSDVLNDSCFPRTLGSEVEPRATFLPYVSEVSVLTVFMCVGMFIAALFLVRLLWQGLKVWFVDHKLHGFLRINGVLFVLALLDFWYWHSTLTHQDKYPVFAVVWLCYSSVAVPVMGYVRYYWRRPLDITKQLHEVDYTEKAVYKKRNGVIKMRMQRMYTVLEIERMPPCYPNGWIPLLESRALRWGKLEGVDALGQRFSLFRSANNGNHYLLDAFCPHMGADITVGGVVRGDCIECPFHGWLIDGRDGRCTRRPGRRPEEETPPVPDNVRAKKFESSEVNGEIYVWFHAEGRGPYWYIPIVEEIQNGTWLYRGRTEHVVRCHIQEIPENGADSNHLEQLHSPSVFLGLRWMDSDSWWNVGCHEWEPEWWQEENKPHIARIRLKQKTTFLGYKVPWGDLELDIHQIGPATVHLYINSPHGRGILIQNITPEGPLTQRIVHQLYTEPTFPAFWASILLRLEAIMFERKIDHLERVDVRAVPPKFLEYHHWYHETFFSEHSPTLQSLEDRLLLF